MSNSPTGRFLRPTSTGFDVHIDNDQVYSIGRLESVTPFETGFDPTWYHAFDASGYRLTEEPCASKFVAAEMVVAAHEEEILQMDAEIAAEQGYERYLENQMWDEYEAFDQYERSLGLS